VLIVATRWNQVIDVVYRRVRATGKPTKVAVVVCMRKVLTILNAIARSGTAWS
jgi:transposase